MVQRNLRIQMIHRVIFRYVTQRFFEKKNQHRDCVSLLSHRRPSTFRRVSIDTPVLFRLSCIFGMTIFIRSSGRISPAFFFCPSRWSHSVARCNDLWCPVDTSLVIPLNGPLINGSSPGSPGINNATRISISWRAKINSTYY